MKQTNCPNCGAPIHDEVCEYCGTRLFRTNNKNIEYLRTELKTFEDRKKCEELYYEALKAMRNYRRGT